MSSLCMSIITRADLEGSMIMDFLVPNAGIVFGDVIENVMDRVRSQTPSAILLQLYTFHPGGYPS